MTKVDVAVIGGGIVGLATALTLAEKTRARVCVIEKEPRLAAHQTGRNSGVMHSGLYYKPGSLKAKNSVRGRALLQAFCDRHGVPYERCGKLVVATREAERPMLSELERRGAENGLVGVRRLSLDEMREREPHVTGLEGLLVPETGIVDYTRVCEAYARTFQALGGEVRLGQALRGVTTTGGVQVLHTTGGDLEVGAWINAAGLHSDRVARLGGVNPGVRIVPFRGEYYSLKSAAAEKVHHLIYPVPDPRFPFLGVHFTRMMRGGVEAGPNAVLAFKREGYSRFAFSLRDTLSFLGYGGFWIMGLKYWPMAIGEMWRSYSKAAFAHALQRLVPDVTTDDLVAAEPGVRAQALDPHGRLLDDFRLVQAARQLHVLNAPSPAATASLAIAEQLTEMACRQFDLALK